jgi:hypothetical protein
MDDSMRELVLVLAGRTFETPWEAIRRFCGLPWADSPGETWAYRYYDAVATDPDRLTEVDVLSAAALHPGLSREDLTYFWEQREFLSQWIRRFPSDLALRDADDGVLGLLDDLAAWVRAPQLTLLTKVLHRKRPHLIPPVDRHVLDLYRRTTGQRTAVAAWSPLLRAMRDDLHSPNAQALTAIGTQIGAELGRELSHVRMVDITIWMERRP